MNTSMDKTESNYVPFARVDLGLISQGVRMSNASVDNNLFILLKDMSGYINRLLTLQIKDKLMPPGYSECSSVYVQPTPVNDMFSYVDCQWKLIQPEKDNSEEFALFCIANEYKNFEQVKSIYVQKYRSEIQVQILINTQEYNDDLMEKMLSVEYDLQEDFGKYSFAFTYPPVADMDRQDIIHPEARCIYAR